MFDGGFGPESGSLSLRHSHDHDAVTGDLPLQKRAGLIQPHEIDLPAEPEGESNLKVELLRKWHGRIERDEPDVHIAVVAIPEERARAEEHNKAHRRPIPKDLAQMFGDVLLFRHQPSVARNRVRCLIEDELVMCMTRGDR